MQISPFWDVQPNRKIGPNKLVLTISFPVTSTISYFGKQGWISIYIYKVLVLSLLFCDRKDLSIIAGHVIVWKNDEAK